MEAAFDHQARVDVGGVIEDLAIFRDVLRSHHGQITWEDRPLTVIITAASEGDLMAIANAVTRAVKAGRARGHLGSAPIFICEPPRDAMMGTYITLKDVLGGRRPVMTSVADETTDIMSLIDAVPDRQEFISRATSTLFHWLRSLYYVRSQVVLRLQFGYMKIYPPPAVTNISWPTFSDNLSNTNSQWALTTLTNASRVLGSMNKDPEMFWPTDHEQKDILLVVFEKNTVEVELDFSGSADDGTYRLQLAGGTAWLPDNLDGHGLEVVSSSPSLSMDWAFRGTTRHPDRSVAARQLAWKLQKGVTYSKERLVGGRRVPIFTIPRQETKILRTILKRPHRFMYKDSTWCVEVTETYTWTGSAMMEDPVVEYPISAFQHEWDEHLGSLDEINDTRPWALDPSMSRILSGTGDDVETRLGAVVEFTEDLRLFLTKAAEN